MIILEGFTLCCKGEMPKNRLRRIEDSFFRGESPPQAENFGILDPLNDDFQRENGPPEAKILAKSGPKPKEPPPLVKDRIDAKGGGLC